MTQYGTIITNIGLAQIANAQVTQQKVGLQYIALGDGNGSYYAPNANQTTLVNEVWRGPVSNVTIDPANDNRIIIEGLIPPTAGGFTIREIAVFDDQNQLIAVGQYPEKYKPQLSEGVSEETLIHFVIETNNVDAVELAIDPTIIIASREYVDEKVAEHKEQITAAVQDLEDLVESIVQTGVAKLVRYSYTIPATTDGQTEIEIPLATFDQDTDTVLLIRNSTVLYEIEGYSISNRKITLVEPVLSAANTSFYLLILKNVPTGEEGGVSGGVITDGSIAKRKLEQTLQDEIESKVSNDALIAHINDTDKHMQEVERTKWNSVSNRYSQYCQIIADWNDAVTNGLYMSAPHAVNAPTAEWYMGEVIAHDPNWITQRITAFSSSRQLWVRHKQGKEWQSWRRGFSNDMGGHIYGDMAIIKDIPQIEMWTPNFTNGVTMRLNANDTVDYGFDVWRNGYVALSINKDGRTFVKDHDGNLFNLADLKLSVSNGKSAVANAITQKGIWTPANAEFATMAANIMTINPGLKKAGGITSTQNTLDIPAGTFDFTPRMIVTHIRINNDYFYSVYYAADFMYSGSPATGYTISRYNSNVNFAGISATIRNGGFIIITTPGYDTYWRDASWLAIG